MATPSSGDRPATAPGRSSSGLGTPRCYGAQTAALAASGQVAEDERDRAGGSQARARRHAADCVQVEQDVRGRELEVLQGAAERDLSVIRDLRTLHPELTRNRPA